MKKILKTLETKGILQESFKFASYLKQNNISNLQIDLKNTTSFTTAIFGAFYANVKFTVLSNNNHTEESFFVNDENFHLLNSVKISEFKELNGEECFFLKTSGSSGESKYIKKTLNQMILEAKFLSQFLNLENGKKLYSSVSHQNMFGMTFKIFLSLISNLDVKEGEFSYPEIIFAQNLDNSILITSPTVLKFLISHKGFECLRKIHLIISAGAKLNDSIKKDFKDKLGISILEIYGSTETGVIAYTYDKLFTKFKQVEISLAKDTALKVNSPWCKDFITSDGVKIDGKNIELLGRLDRNVKISEKRVNLDEIERFILQNNLIENLRLDIHPKIQSRISALLVLSKKGEEIFRQKGRIEIINNLKDYLNKDYKNILRYFKITNEIPINANSKITKNLFYSKLQEKLIPKFNLINNVENTYVFVAKLNVWDFYFGGHFSNFPILPGFIQVNFVLQCLEIIQNKKINPKKIENIKFSSLLRPLDEIKIKIEIKEFKIYFTILNGEKICSSGRFYV